MGSAARKIAGGVAAESRGRMKECSSAPCRTGDQKLLSASMARQRHAVEVRKPRAARLKDGAGSKVSSAVICIFPGGFAGLLTGRMATACASGCALAHLSGAGLAEQKREPERTDEARRQPVSGVGQVVRGGAAMGEHGRRGRHENPDRHPQERQCRVSRLPGARRSNFRAVSPGRFESTRSMTAVPS